MQSHRFDVSRHDLVRNLLWPLLPVLLFVATMHALSRWSPWPRPRPALDTERTVLIHQADACRTAEQTDVLLLGDSSALMNVSARLLSERLTRPTRSLATFSFLDLQAHARFLREFSNHHPKPPTAVVLLMHPEALRRLDSEPFYLAALTNYWAGRDHCEPATLAGRLSCLFGVDVFRGRFLTRLLPTPLSGAYGRRYGFTWDLERFLAREQGSAIDPESQLFTGSTEYRLSATLERSSQVFRAALPKGTKLCVGISPVPAKFAGTNYPARQVELLRQWADWLKPDALLTNLPATMPDEAFVRTTHLRETQVPTYTDYLAQALRTSGTLN